MIEPIISILMPVKNAARYLEACLDSISNQSFTTWELIAIDDHSSDNSVEIMKASATQDHRIKVFSNNGKGIIPALKMAYALSTGLFITRMDADDLMDITKLERLVEQAQIAGEGFVSTACVKYFSDEQLGDGYKKYESWLNGLMRNGDHYNSIYKECVIPSPCWMLHRSDFEKIGAFKNNSYPEDYDLCFRMYEHQLGIIANKQVLHFWRDHNQRASRNDPNYADNRFLELKLRYFLKLEPIKTKQLVLWGAGKKAKWIANELIRNDLRFSWVSNNPRKINHKIYGQLIANCESLIAQGNDLIIVAVANMEDQKEIRNTLSQLDKIEGKDYFFFC